MLLHQRRQVAFPVAVFPVDKRDSSGGDVGGSGTRTDANLSGTGGHLLGIEGLRAHAGSQELRSSRRYQQLGRVILKVVATLLAKPRADQRLMAAGHVVCLWSRPYLWEKATGRLRDLGLPPPTPM